MNNTQPIPYSDDTNPEDFPPLTSHPGVMVPINGDVRLTDHTNGTTTAFDPSDAVRPPRHALQTPLQPLPGAFKLLQSWEGRVMEVNGEQFVAVISDRTNPSLPDEIVTLDKDEITPDDMPLLKPGAVFYWSIGYADYPGRGRTRESRMRFRRLPGWTQAEIDNARETGKRLEALFSD